MGANLKYLIIFLVLIVGCNGLSKTERIKAMVNPTVHVRSNTSTIYGSGVVIASTFSKEVGLWNTYILTCDHIVRGTGPDYTVRFFNLLNTKTSEYTDGRAVLIRSDKKRDLALLLVKGVPPKIIYTAELNEKNPSLFDKVYMTGFPAKTGFTVITDGIVTYSRNARLVVTCPGFFGVSGGPIYLKNGEMVGIVNAMWQYKKKLVTHIMHGASVESIRSFFKESDLEYLLETQ